MCAVKPRFFLSQSEIFVRHQDDMGGVGFSSAIDAIGAYPLNPRSGLGRVVTAQQVDCWSHKLELTISPEKNSSKGHGPSVQGNTRNPVVPSMVAAVAQTWREGWTAQVGLLAGVAHNDEYITVEIECGWTSGPVMGDPEPSPCQSHHQVVLSLPPPNEEWV